MVAFLIKQKKHMVKIRKEFLDYEYTGLDLENPNKQLFRVKFKDLSVKFVSLYFELVKSNKGNLKYFEHDTTARPEKRSNKELHISDKEESNTEKGRDIDTTKDKETERKDTEQLPT